jgi:homoserine dehydrogenase
MSKAKKRKTEQPGRELTIGLIGCGTVGQSVLEILRDRADLLKQIGLNVCVKKIAVRDPTKSRSYIPEGAELVSSFSEIIDDDSINCVVEVMGGTTLAKDAVYQSAAKGKHIITANKALLAEHLPELMDLVAKNGIEMGYEAAVCGGIPIIHALQKDFLFDSITQICGIMNGTTNFILSKMENEGADYATVLKEAQDLGFAEADPSADVDGFDVRAKIGLLARLAYGTYVECESIPTTGITRITADDFLYAKHLNATVKLLGIAKMNDGKLSIAVAPHMVPKSNPIGNISGATNIVSVESQSLGTSFFVGQGAGGLPTANSVVSDIIALAQGQSCAPFPKTAPTNLESDFQSRFYIRFVVRDQVGIIKSIADACVKQGISIASIEQTPIETDAQRKRLPFVVTTDTVEYSKVNQLAEAVCAESFNVVQPFVMPML